MKTIGNLLWLVLNGIWLALFWLLIAAVLAISVIGLPFARQSVKLAHFALWPFGRTVVKSPDAATLGPIGAVLWFVPGAFLALAYLFSGIVMCITVIGIPFGVQAFKLAGLALAPFGKEIIKRKDVTDALAAARSAN